VTVPLVILLGGLVIFGLVLLVRYVEGREWRASLVAYRLSVPPGLKGDQAAAWLASVAAATHAPRIPLVQPPPVALEIVGTREGIRHVLYVPSKMNSAVLSGLRAALPGVRLEEAPGELVDRTSWQVAVEGRLTGIARPLALDRAEQAAAGVMAALQPLYVGEEVRVQWIFCGARTPRPVRAATKGKNEINSLLDLLDADKLLDSEALRAARLKQREPLLHAVVRVGVRASDRARWFTVFGQVWGSLRALNAPGAVMVRRWLPSFVVSQRLQEFGVPLTMWPVRANVRELAGIIGLPLGDLALPGLAQAVARQLPPQMNLPSIGTVVATSTYPGLSSRPLALKTSDRLRHAWILGPTGTGKSTLLANLITQDIAAGRGVVVVDPKGDLVGDVLDRVPAERHDDLLVISPGETDRPVGLNLLDIGASEHARELAVDHLTGVMANLWRSSWGPRTSDVIRNALLTLTHTKAVDGSQFTLVELPELLLNAAFRGFVTSQPTMPDSVRSFWLAYEQMSDGERAQVIGPSLNKLRSFTTRTALRLMLGQSHGVRLNDVFTKRRIILVNLAKGILGAETTALVGSLVMAGLWQATLGRVTVPHERRHPVFVYLDEFQDFLRLNIDLADMLAQARGLGVGLTLAHQYLGQLTDDVKMAVLDTTRSKVVFQVEYDDAALLAKRFAPLTQADLSGLPAYEIALRPCVDGASLGPVTGRTLAPSTVVTNGVELAKVSRSRFGQSRADVEAALRRRVEVGSTVLGREGCRS
jgi:hypothetical protein